MPKLITAASIITARINGIEVEVPEGTSILAAARAAHIRIPTLCKHPDLAPTSACGLCIVRIAGGNRLPRACATAVEPGMDITTHDAGLTEVRRSTIELILSNHPNSCLTCGRNGCCELQTLAAEFGIRHDDIPRYVRDLPCDDSTGSITLDFTKCIKCGRCIAVCQNMQNVWALSFLERGINTRMAPAGDILLAESPCVRCGQCSAHCPTGAIIEVDETAAAWDALRDPAKFPTVQVAPSVRVAIGEAFGLAPGVDLTGKLYTALRRLGFKAVFDTNFSADLTTRELARMIKQSGLDFLNLPDGEPDSILGTYSGSGLIFGATGGVMEAALRTAVFRITGQNLETDAISIHAIRGLDGIRGTTLDVGGHEVRVAVAHGLGNVEKLLLRVREAREHGEPPPYHFIEVMACPGGCIGGGGQPYGVTDDVRTKRAAGLYQGDGALKLRFSHENPEILRVYHDFLGEPLGERAHELLHTHYHPRSAYQR